MTLARIYSLLIYLSICIETKTIVLMGRKTLSVVFPKCWLKNVWFNICCLILSRWDCTFTWLWPFQHFPLVQRSAFSWHFEHHSEDIDFVDFKNCEVFDSMQWNCARFSCRLLWSDNVMPTVAWLNSMQLLCTCILYGDAWMLLHGWSL